jgi:hypothetical protein
MEAAKGITQFLAADDEIIDTDALAERARVKGCGYRDCNNRYNFAEDGRWLSSLVRANFFYLTSCTFIGVRGFA